MDPAEWLGRVRVGDAEEWLASMAAESVHCCITSPPYWGLRDYQTEGQIGLEATPEEYIEKMVGVFREVRRVLRSDGTVFLNMGDSYWSDTLSRKDPVESMWGNRPASDLADGRDNIPEGNKRGGLGERPAGLKPKDLCGIPWRLALALQADGWWLRSDIVWSKPNPMPESVTDRPTRSHEYVFLLTKAARYWYDADAVREAAIHAGRVVSYDGTQKNTDHENRRYPGAVPRDITVASGRNLRTVWTIATEPFPEAHFATFPTKLVAPCLKAGCPHKVCAECGAPWVREVEASGETTTEKLAARGYSAKRGQEDSRQALDYAGGHGDNARQRRTLGFLPTCECHPSGLVPVDMMRTRPGIVIDPFMGSGTVGLMAERLQRRWAGCDISADYAAMATERIERERAQLHLPLEV